MADETGASFIALNPLHAIFNRAPYNTSPYLPNSIFYRNPIYLDVEQIEDFPDFGAGAGVARVARGADRDSALRGGRVRRV